LNNTIQEYYKTLILQEKYIW